MGWRRGEEGVSEVVATTLLVGVTVLAVAIVAAIVLSAPQPGEIPHAAIVAKNESGKFGLAHEGGDPLRVGEYRIYVADGGGLVDETGNFSSPEGGVWGIGEDIAYNGGSTDFHRVIVTTLVGGGGEVILTEVRLRGGGGFDPDPVKPPEEDPEEPEEFIDFVVNENVFVYGTTLSMGQGGAGTGGTTVNGPGATVVIKGGLETKDLGGTGGIEVSYIYIDGDVNLSSGKAALGSSEDPGSIYVNGTLELWNSVSWDGGWPVYGDVYINGDFRLKNADIHGNVYVDGDLILGDDSAPTLAENKRIYYTGTLMAPSNYDANIIGKCVHKAKDWEFEMPVLEVSSTKPSEWYDARNYTSSGYLESNLKIFADSYSSEVSRNPVHNVVIVANNGDISITGNEQLVTGVFFAPKGKVIFGGNSLEGVVIARDGFFVTSGGTQVTFKNIEEYIANPEDYPF